MTETRNFVPERDEPTPQPSAAGRGGRRGPLGRVALFYREVLAELRKVVWPSRKELVTYTSVVLIFVTMMVAIVAALDYTFTRGVLAIFG